MIAESEVNEDFGWIRASDVKVENVEWLWPGRIPRGMFSLFASPQGSGKSTTLADIAARVTRGARWPDAAPHDSQQPAGTVLWIASEERPENVIVPRLLAAGADIDRIRFHPSSGGQPSGELPAAPFTLDRDLEKVRLLCLKLSSTEHPVRLVVMDPLIDAMPGVDVYKEAPVRAALAPLIQVAAETRAAFVGVMHIRKQASRSAVNTVAGSGAFTQMARTVIAIVEREDGSELRTLGTLKCNVGAFPKDITVRLERRQIEANGVTVKTSAATWLPDRPPQSAREMLVDDAHAGLRAPKRSEAERFLLDMLRSGPRKAAEVKIAAEAAGIQSDTLKNAREALMGRGVMAKPYRDGGTVGEPWKWKLLDE